MVPPPTQPHGRRSFAQRLIRTEPLALMLLLVLAVLLFALVMIGAARQNRPATQASAPTSG